MRIRDGKITKEDWKILKSRSVLETGKPKNWDDIIRLFYRGDDVLEYNLKKLKEMEQNGAPVAKILAEHGGNKTARRATANEAWGLQSVLYLAQKAKVMLRNNLLPAKYGLVNGSQGKIIDIIYESNKAPDDLPKCVIVDFPDYKGPSLFKAEEHRTYVPIVPFTAKFESAGKSCYRTQLPLKLSFAMTIHKSQGLTLDQVVVDLGSRENPMGDITFVALSRVKTLEGLYLKSPTWPRLEAINKKEMTLQRIFEEKRLGKLRK